MQALAIGIAITLGAIVILHVLWGIGIWWPLTNEPDLAKSVVGASGIEKMPGAIACFAVASALFLTALIVIVMGRLIAVRWIPEWSIVVSGGIAALVFIIRGGIGYAQFWARLTPEQPFRTYDIWYYSPLCLALGLAMFALLFSYPLQGA